MGSCWTKTKDFVVGFLVYDTVSIVRINDKRLAIMHYLCMIGILIYILGYTVWYNQAYYAVEAPVGTVRINPMAPPERDKGKDNNWTDIPDLRYCKYGNRTKLYGYDLLDCKYFDSAIDVFPQAIDSSITISTRIRCSSQETSNIYFNTSDTVWNDKPNTTESYYLADIERFTLQIDHTFFAPILDLQDNARDMKGFIKYANGTDVKLCEPKVETLGDINETDILSVCTLLRAAEINIDNETVHGKECIRYSGAIFLVFLDYQNSVTRFFQPDTHYTVTVKLINNTEYKAVQAVYTKTLKERTIYNRHGLHFVFLQTGKLVKFDFQVLLLSLVSGMGMIAFSTTIVDLISTKVLGNKDVVSNLKYRTTPNLTQFSDEQLCQLAEKLKRTQQQELALSKAEDGDGEAPTPGVNSDVRLREPLIDKATDE